MLATKKSAVVALVLLLGLGMAGCGLSPVESAREGARLLSEGKAPEAAIQLASAATALKTNASVWNHAGLAQHQAGDLLAAAKSYQQALALAKDRDLKLVAQSRFNLGVLYLEQGNLPAAEAELKAYMVLEPRAAEGWLRLGKAQLRGRQFEAAERSLNQARNLQPRDPEVLNDLGLIQIQRKRPAEAYNFFLAAAMVQRDYRPALLNLAITDHQHLNHHTRALKEYKDFLALEPAGPRRAAVELAVRRLEQELSPAGVPRATATNNPPATNLASVLAPRATGAVASAATNKPIVTVAKTNVAPPVATKVEPTPEPKVVVQVPTETPIPVAREIEKPGIAPAAQATPVTEREPVTRSPVPAVVVPPPKPNFPRYVYKRPVKPAPGDRAAAVTWFDQGVAAQKNNQFALAMEHQQKAVRLDAAFYEAQFNLAVAAFNLGDFPVALTAYESALAIQPESTAARFNFATVLQRAGYPLDAAEELKTVIAAAPNETRAHFALGYLYAQQLREPKLARTHYGRVLELDPRHAQATEIRRWLTANP